MLRTRRWDLAFLTCATALLGCSTRKVEASLQELKKRYTVVLAPHSVQQAARTADYAAFFLAGELIEYGSGAQIFTNPTDQRTEDYVQGRFG